MRFLIKFFTAVSIMILWASNISIAFANDTNSTLPSGITYSKIEERIESYVTAHENTTAGMAVAVFNRDNVIYQGSFGYADKEKQIAVDKETVFEWGSVSKILVWISVMQLQEEGKIDFNTDIRTYLPEGFLHNLNYDTPITMLNLMNHNAGFQEMVSDLFLADKNDVLDLGEQLKQHEPEQIYEPGTVTAYSNWGTALAGYIVERISGEPYFQYVNDHIFKKLGMKHTAIAYDLSDNEWVRQKRNELQCYTSAGKLLGNGFYYIPLYPCGMCTGTLEDFLTFAQALLPSDEKSSPLFEKEDTLNTMLSPTSYYPETDIPLNCHGLWTLENKVEVIGHGGNTAGCSSYLLIDPNSDTGTVVMTNQKNELIYNYGMMPLIFGSFNQSKLFQFGKEEVSGYYYPARTITEGPLSLYSMFNIHPMGPNESHIFWVYSSHNSQEKYTINYGDYLKITPSKYIPVLSLFILFFFANIYSAITLVGGFTVAPLQRRIRRRKGLEQIRHSFRKWNYCSCGLILILTANILWLCYQVYTYAPSQNYCWQFGANGILMILMAFFVVMLIANWKKIGTSKSEKIKYIITSACLIIIIIFVIYWKLYAFWKL